MILRGQILIDQTVYLMELFIFYLNAKLPPKGARNQDMSQDMHGHETITNLPYTHWHGRPSIGSVDFANEVEILEILAPNKH